MPVNQPPITSDQTLDAWLLEITNEINRLEVLVAALQARIETLERGRV